MQRRGELSTTLFQQCRQAKQAGFDQRQSCTLKPIESYQ